MSELDRDLGPTDEEIRLSAQFRREIAINALDGRLTPEVVTETSLRILGREWQNPEGTAEIYNRIVENDFYKETLTREVYPDLPHVDTDIPDDFDFPVDTLK